jgi:hypothetical protein
MARIDTDVYPLMLALTGCLSSTLEEFGVAMCKVYPTFDDEIDMAEVGQDGGVGYVKLLSLGPSEPERPSTCGSGVVVSFEVGLGICYPVNDDGDSLTVDQQIEVGQALVRAMQASWAAISCCEWAGDHRRHVYVDGWTGFGPSGGIIGGSWAVEVNL